MRDLILAVEVKHRLGPLIQVVPTTARLERLLKQFGCILVHPPTVRQEAILGKVLHLYLGLDHPIGQLGRQLTNLEEPSLNFPI